MEILFEIIDANSTATKPKRSLVTTYEIFPNTFVMSRGFILEHSSSPRFGSCEIHIKTVDVLPCESPIFEACRSFDLEEVRRVFACGLASPSDRDIYGTSPLERALEGSLSLALKDRSFQEQIERFKTLLQFLMDLSGQSNLSVNPDLVSDWILCEQAYSKRISSWRTDTLRLILSMTITDPFLSSLSSRALNL